jgi:hypothetical protein
MAKPKHSSGTTTGGAGPGGSPITPLAVGGGSVRDNAVGGGSIRDNTASGAATATSGSPAKTKGKQSRKRSR